MKAALKIGSWNLNDLLDTSDNKLQIFLDSIEERVKRLEDKRNYLSADIPADKFESLIHEIEDLYEKLSIVSGYAHLQYYADTSSNEYAALLTRIEKFSANVNNRLLFFDLWFKKGIDEDNANRLINSMPEVYREYLRHKRLLAKYVLSEVEERLINTLDVTGSSALVKIYDKMTSAFEFNVSIKKGKRVIKKVFKNKEKMISLVRSPKAEEREAVYRALWQVYGKNASVLGEIYQNLVIKLRDEYVVMRGYPSPISARNAANDLDDSTVQSLLESCRKNSHIFHEYFTLKAKLLGIKLRRYDLYAPVKSTQRRFSYNKAVELVLSSFEELDPRFKEFAKQVFEENHVDSEIRKGKRGGAFCYSVTPKITPYVLLNYNGTLRDVSTLAHEFGHAIHSMAASDKPILVAQAPLPLAETASVFAEMLLNDRLESIISEREKLSLICEEIDDMYATIMRQAYFTLFEIDAHQAIGEKNATIDDVSNIYMKNLEEQFGSSVKISSDFRNEWLYIPHFYHTPFYCYAYSFGNLLALSLYQQYKLERDGFVEKYLNILAAGGSRKPEDLLRENGIDISEKFWQQGFDYISSKIRELKKIA